MNVTGRLCEARELPYGRRLLSDDWRRTSKYVDWNTWPTVDPVENFTNPVAAST